MLALVMSGAANFGAMQAGALEVLLEQGLMPRMVVGSSAGALNAIYLGARPSLEGVQELQDTWRRAGPDQVGVPKPFVALRRIVSGKDGLLASEALAAFLRENLPRGMDTFGELTAKTGIRAYAVAVGMRSGKMRVFGDDPQDRLLDGAMASTAVPPYFPPWPVGDERYLDGGVFAKLPLTAAIERGATRIVGLNVGFSMGSNATAKGILGISGYALSLMVEAQRAYEECWARRLGAALRVIELPAPIEVSFWDYGQADRLISLGRELARQALAAEPLRLGPGWRARLRRALKRGALHTAHQLTLPESAGV